MIKAKTETNLDKNMFEADVSVLNNTMISRDEAFIYVRLKPTHKLTFILGLALGVFVLQHQVLIDASQVSIEC